MSTGFGEQKKESRSRTSKGANITIDLDNIDIILKQYKNIKKYRKSSMYAIKTIDGTEDIISSLIKEAEENPL
jgi:hypothetical protein